MPRFFVNGMANFVINGGMVYFTLQDQALRTEGNQLRPAPPEDVVDIAMREQDFAQLMAILNQNIAGYEAQSGRKLAGGGTPVMPPQAGAAQKGPMSQPAPAKPGVSRSGGMKIRPKGS